MSMDGKVDEKQEKLDKRKKDESKYLQNKMSILEKISKIRKELDLLQEKEPKSDIEKAELEFEESKLLQEYNELTLSAKNIDLTLKEIRLDIQYLEGSLGMEDRAKGRIDINKKREELFKEEEIIHSRTEIEKIKAEIEMHKVNGEQDKVDECTEKLNNEKEMYKQASGEEYKEKDDKNENSGYKREENDDFIKETYEQILTDDSGEKIGTSMIIDEMDISTGNKKIRTLRKLEDDKGNYSFKEVAEGAGDEYIDRKELTSVSKKDGNATKYVFEKDEKNNRQTYYEMKDGKLAFKMVKTDKGTVIDTYDKNGQLVDSFEYDENGKPLLEMIGIDRIDENYLENYFESQMPDFEVQNQELSQEDKTELLGNSVLESAVEATKQGTRVEEINKQAEMAKQTQKQRTQTNYKQNDEQSK